MILSKFQYKTSHVFLTHKNPEGKCIYRVNKLSYQTPSLVVTTLRIRVNSEDFYFSERVPQDPDVLLYSKSVMYIQQPIFVH